MSDIAITTAAEPDGAPRIAVLDILRGIAILGILFMNINDMGQAIQADFRHLGWSSGDQIAWWLREVLANGTARCLLEMLFGAGMVILTDRAAQGARRWAVLRGYYVRNIVLYAIGLAHLYLLLWPGDILHTYAVAALVTFLFRRLRPRWLIAIGLIGAVMQLGVGGYFGYYAVAHDRTVIAAIAVKQAHGVALDQTERASLAKAQKNRVEREKRRKDAAADVVREDSGRSSTSLAWVRTQWRISTERAFGIGEIFSIWEAAGTMLIGAALFKLGILQGLRRARFYLVMTVCAYAFGLTTRAIGAYEMTRFDDAPRTIWATAEFARLSTTIGHVGLVNLLALSVGGAALLRPFVAAGRTALSVYIAQTLICLWVLYPPFMLALYGKMTWWPLMATAFVINAVLLWGANLWVRHFDIAPVEWAWRSLVGWRRLPFRTVRSVS